MIEYVFYFIVALIMVAGLVAFHKGLSRYSQEDIPLKRLERAKPHGWDTQEAQESRKAEQELMALHEEPLTPEFSQRLLDYYQLSVEFDQDKGLAIFTDRKYFNLKRRTVDASLEQLLKMEDREYKQLLARVRYTFNRRAKRAGLVGKEANV